MDIMALPKQLVNFTPEQQIATKQRHGKQACRFQLPSMDQYGCRGKPQPPPQQKDASRRPLVDERHHQPEVSGRTYLEMAGQSRARHKVSGRWNMSEIRRSEPWLLATSCL